jgi:hypothetical protein
VPPPIPPAISTYHRIVALSSAAKAEVAAMDSANEEENARGSGFTHDLDEIKLEPGHLGDLLGGSLADRVDMIGLGLASQPRGQIGIVAEYRTVEKLVRSRIAGNAATSVETEFRCELRGNHARGSVSQNRQFREFWATYSLLAMAQENFAMEIARSRLFESFALAALHQRQEWELPLASEPNCNRIKV